MAGAVRRDIDESRCTTSSPKGVSSSHELLARMSNAHLNWAMRRNISPSRKLVLLKLSDMANEKGVCWPSIANIARDCRLSARSVQRVLRELETNRLIRVFARHRSDGSRTSNGYVVAPDGGVDSSPPATHMTPPYDNTVTGVVTPMSPLQPTGGPPKNHHYHR